MKNKKSRSLFKKACRFIPGGVNSPVRAFKSVNSDPLFIKKARGSSLWDADGNVYLDYLASWGPMLLGHAHPAVARAVKKALKRGTSFGAPTQTEVELAELITRSIPSIQSVRLVNSGTEATMSALRLARAYTKKDKVIKFEGCYHGHCDSFLIKAGSGATTLGHPSSPGVTEGTAGDTLLARYNNIESVEKLFAEHNDIGTVIIEPVPANMGVILPEDDFLKKLAEVTKKNNALLIFDEVITGFRMTGLSAQEYFNVTPDLTTLGKIIGGGFPVGAFGGRKEIMDKMAPSGPVYQAGTLSGNPIAAAAGLKTLKIILKEGIIDEANFKAGILFRDIKETLIEEQIEAGLNHITSFGTLFFTGEKVNNYKQALKSDTRRYAAYFIKMLEQGIYLAPSQFEACFVSAAHSRQDIQKTVRIFKKVIKKV